MFARAVYRRSLALPVPCHLRVSVHCISAVSAPSACSTFALEKDEAAMRQTGVLLSVEYFQENSVLKAFDR